MLKLSKEALRVIQENHPMEDEIIALYDCRHLEKPAALYRTSESLQALEHAWRHDYLAVTMTANGELRGHESGPEDGLTFDQLMNRLAAVAQGATADGIAVVAAVAEYWDWRSGWEYAAEEKDAPEGPDFRLLALRQMHAEASGRPS